MTQPTIRTAEPDDVDLVASIIAEAFQHLTVAHWLVSEERHRRRVMQANMRIHVRHALDGHGIVDIAEGERAVAVWFPNGTEPGIPPADYDLLLDAACGVYADNFRQLDAVLAAHHPHHQPHHHLAFLAVLPDHQGHGLGGALLDHHHDKYPDTARYLEASSAQSRRLYLRHGYHDHHDEPFTVPDAAPLKPLFWPMWRNPRPTTT